MIAHPCRDQGTAVTVQPRGQIEAVGASHDRELGIGACTRALALDRVPAAKPDPSARYMSRPRELGGSRAPSFPVPRCMHYRPPARSAHPIVPQQPETTLGD
jgi:hypothetical protein